jgi:ketosteroid isomerase-like protein
MISPFLTDDFQSVAVLPAQTRTYKGPEGFRKNWLDWLEPWATYRSKLISASICTIREGKIARWEDYTDRATALEAVGLRE